MVLVLVFVGVIFFTFSFSSKEPNPNPSAFPFPTPALLTAAKSFKASEKEEVVFVLELSPAAAAMESKPFTPSVLVVRRIPPLEPALTLEVAFVVATGDSSLGGGEWNISKSESGNDFGMVGIALSSVAA